MKIRLLPYVLIILAGLCWGMTFSLTLIAASSNSSPLVLVTVQAFLSGTLFSLVCLAIRLTPFRIRHLRYYLVLTVLGIIAPNFLYYSAAPHLSAGILSITVSTVPMLTYALAWVLRSEKASLRRGSGIILGMLAILLLVLPDQGLDSSDASFWTLLVLISAVCYSIENMYIADGIDESVDIRELLCGSNIIATVILVPMMLLQGHRIDSGMITGTAGLAVLGISVLSTVAYMMYFQAIRLSGPVFASQCAYIVTLAGVLWGILLLSESHTVWVWLSVAVMVAGLALVSPVSKSGPAQFGPVPDSDAG